MLAELAAIQLMATALAAAAAPWRMEARRFQPRSALPNYPYAAAFAESIDVLHDAGVAMDNSGYLILSTLLEIPHGN
jgi:hypothetical protein